MIHRTKTTVLSGGKIILENVPFEPGTKVTVIISLKRPETDIEDTDSAVEASDVN